MKFEIPKLDKKVPIPQGRITIWKALAERAEHGDSFLVSEQVAASASASIRRQGYGAVTRMQADKRVRVWVLKKK